MTGTVVLAGCPSAVVVTESLLAAGIPINEIVTLGSDAAKTLGHVPMTSTISHRACPDAGEPDAKPIRIDADLVVSVFTATPSLVGCADARMRGCGDNSPGLHDETVDGAYWSRPARVVQRTVWAATLPGRGAWTWFGTARLGMSAATETESAVPGVPSGTVIGHAADSLIVQTGSGALRIGGLRDLLGPVDASKIPVGTRLGRDASTELADLTRRIQDLERLVLVMAGDTDLLSQRASQYLPHSSGALQERTLPE